MFSRPRINSRGRQVICGGAPADSLPPCGGGVGWGGVQRGSEVPHLATPTPSPQGGGENFAARSRPSSAPPELSPGHAFFRIMLHFCAVAFPGRKPGFHFSGKSSIPSRHAFTRRTG